MLVLSRQRDESVFLILPDGTELEVCVVDVRGDKVRLGFEAPPRVAVHRGEVLALIRADAAARGLDLDVHLRDEAARRKAYIADLERGHAARRKGDARG